MLFASWQVFIVKNTDRYLESVAQGCRPRIAFSSLRSEFFIICTNPRLVNNLIHVFIFSTLSSDFKIFIIE